MNKISLSLAIVGSICFALGFGSALCLFPPTSGEDNPRVSMNHIGQHTNPESLPDMKSKRVLKSPSSHSNFAPSVEAPNRELQANLVDQILSGRGRASILQENTVSDALADWLGMTSDERKLVDHALKEALSTLKLEQHQNTRILNSDQDSADIIIQKFDTSGAALKNRLNTCLKESLGNERTVLFQRLARDTLEDNFLSFGQKDVRICVKGLSKESDYEIRVNIGDATRIFETQDIPEVLKDIIDVTSN
jgi:hypothetical protein